MAQKEIYPSTKDILFLLGMGSLLAASVIMPGIGIAGGAIYRAKKKSDYLESQKAWKKFNTKYLKRNLKRLHQQKVVELVEKDGQEVIKLTNKGKTKFLKFKLEELSLKGKSWDGKWRLVLYDISKLKRNQQESFRRILKQMHFLLLQKSAYLTPYKCQEEINYLREYFTSGRKSWC